MLDVPPVVGSEIRDFAPFSSLRRWTFDVHSLFHFEFPISNFEFSPHLPLPFDLRPSTFNVGRSMFDVPNLSS